MTRHLLRAAALLFLAAILSGCGLAQTHAHRAGRLLTAPVRAVLWVAPPCGDAGFLREPVIEEGGGGVRR